MLEHQHRMCCPYTARRITVNFSTDVCTARGRSACSCEPKQWLQIISRLIWLHQRRYISGIDIPRADCRFLAFQRWPVCALLCSEACRVSNQPFLARHMRQPHPPPSPQKPVPQFMVLNLMCTRVKLLFNSSRLAAPSEKLKGAWRSSGKEFSSWTSQTLSVHAVMTGPTRSVLPCLYQVRDALVTPASSHRGL